MSTVSDLIREDSLWCTGVNTEIHTGLSEESKHPWSAQSQGYPMRHLLPPRLRNHCISRSRGTVVDRCLGGLG